jgi:hypothetical protein
MDLVIGSSLMSVVLAVAATVLALSLLVQVLQELWKFLFSTRSACYTRVLQDFLGPWAKRMTEPGVLPEFVMRGPFQFRRQRPTGNLEPLATPQLVEGLERTAAPWLRRALRALRLEAELQPAGPEAPSPEWKRFVSEVTQSEGSGPGGGDARDVATFLAQHNLGADKKMPAKIAAQRALLAFRERFFPHVRDAEQHAGRLREMFDCQYRRRNQLITFVLGFTVAFVCDQPIQHVINRARAMSPEEASALAANVLQMYEATQAARDTAAARGDTAAAAPELPQLESALSGLVQTLDSLARRDRPDAAPTSLLGFSAFGSASWPGRAWYVLGSLLTAVLLSFGAPFWNDLVGALSNRNRGAPRPRAPAEAAPAAAASPDA